MTEKNYTVRVEFKITLEESIDAINEEEAVKDIQISAKMGAYEFYRWDEVNILGVKENFTYESE